MRATTNDTTTNAGGVKINLVSRTFLDPMPSPEKVRFILDEVASGKVLVLERGLTPYEEAALIEATMAKIDVDRFIGIEMQSYQQDPMGRWTRILNAARKPRPRMVVIGPASLLRTVSKDSHSIEAVILAPHGVGTGG